MPLEPEVPELTVTLPLPQTPIMEPDLAPLTEKDADEIVDELKQDITECHNQLTELTNRAESSSNLTNQQNIALLAEIQNLREELRNMKSELRQWQDSQSQARSIPETEQQAAASVEVAHPEAETPPVAPVPEPTQKSARQKIRVI